MINSLKSPLHLLAASLLVGGLSFASVASAIQIEVQPDGDVPDQTDVKMDVAETDTIGDIKGRLETTDAGYPPEMQHLYLGDKELKDDEKIKDLGIKEGDVLVLKLR
jgi:hypothetical protein